MYELGIHAFVSLNCFFSIAVSLWKWLAHFLLIRSNGETRRNKHFSRLKNFWIFIRLRFQGYRCKSGIVIFAFRVTWNYAYSPYKLCSHHVTFRPWPVTLLLLQEELGKRLKMNINTEKKLIKEVSTNHDTERKSFEVKMKAEYKLKKDRWKREMENQETPKSQRNQGN